MDISWGVFAEVAIWVLCFSLGMMSGKYRAYKEINADKQKMESTKMWMDAINKMGGKNV